MSEKSVLCEIDSRGVARVTLNRPDVRNAMNEVLIADLLETLEQVAADDSARFMVITGNGKGFCAGGDLNWMRRTADYAFQENYDDALVLGRLMRRLFEMPKPTLALVNGAAFGGGMGLVAGCDIAIAAEEAKFSLSEVKLGLLPATIAPYVVRAMGARDAVAAAGCATTSPQAMRRRVRDWFDGFRTLKLIHAARDGPHPLVPWRTAFARAPFLEAAPSTRSPDATIDEMRRELFDLDQQPH